MTPRRSVTVAYVLIAAVVGLSIWGGLHVRRWAWDHTQSIRFQGDIRNGFNWGSRANDVGVVELYDDLVADRHDPRRGYRLDYAPMRLLVMTTWVRWLRGEHPDIQRWENDYDHTWPLLYFNLACQLASLPAMFLLVRLWGRRGGGAPVATAIVAALATLLLWWNPAVICNAHTWPQWDVWCLPFFLWAVYLASVERWLAAGLLIAVGAMFKGQVLLVAPVLVLWPLLRGRFGCAGRVLLGAALGAGVAASPWLLRGWDARLWLTLLLLPGLALVGLAAHRLRWSRGTALTAGLAWLTTALWITAAVHDASFAWYEVGFRGPTDNHRAMFMGPVNNLAALLHHRYGWGLFDPVALPGLAATPSMRTLLVAAYALALVICSAATARFDRRRDPRFLLAVIAPWVFMFALLPQMHERYLLWGAACSAAWIALGVGPLLLHLFLSALAWAMMAQSMLNHDRAWSPGLLSFLNGMHPDIAWALLAVATVLLVMMFARSGRHAGPESAKVRMA